MLQVTRTLTPTPNPTPTPTPTPNPNPTMLQNELSAAIADLRMAVKLDPGSMLAAIQLGMALHRNQQPTEARAIFEQAEAMPLGRKGAGYPPAGWLRSATEATEARLRRPPSAPEHASGCPSLRPASARRFCTSPDSHPPLLYPGALQHPPLTLTPHPSPLTPHPSPGALQHLP